MDLFDTFFGELLMTFLIAMVPVLELRGAIPAGIAAGLPPAAAAAAAILGNLVPIPFLILLLRRIFGWLRKSSWVGPKIDWLERRAHLKGRIVKKYRTIGLIILVAIPLPGTRGLDRRPGGRCAGPPAPDSPPRHRAWRPHRRNHYHHRDLRRHSSLLVSFAVRV